MAGPAGATTAPSAKDQLDDLREAAAAAAASGGGWFERTIAVAGIPFRLRFANEALLEALYPSFAHLEAAGPVPEATVEVFETARSGVARPSLPWTGPTEAPGDSLVRLEEGEIQGVAGARSTQVVMADLPGRVAVVHLPDIESVPRADIGARLRPPLLLLFGAVGPLPLHAGAVAAGDSGALIAGMSGAGKSTLTIACALEGLSVCGDDYVVLDDSADPPSAHALNSTVRLAQESAQLLELGLPPSAFDPAEMPPLDPKGQFELEALAPGSLRRQLNLRALVVPRRGPEANEPHEIGPAAALRALAPSTLLQSPGRRPRTLTALGELVSRLRCFELPTGVRPREAAVRLRELLQGLD